MPYQRPLPQSTSPLRLGRIFYIGVVTALLVVIGRNVYRTYQRSLSTEMCVAAERGDVRRLQSLLDKGIDVNTRDTRGFTPLMKATISGQTKAATFLLAHGAQVDDGSFPIAALYGYTAIFNLLLQHHANIHQVMPNKIVSNEPDVEQCPPERCTPLYEAASWGHTEIVRSLLAQGADANETDRHGYTPLMEAARNGRYDIVASLLARGADVHATTHSGYPTGYTPLLFAAESGDAATLRCLLDHKADVNEGNKDGYTALMLTLLKRHAAAARLLMAHGADVNAHAQDGATALKWAKRQQEDSLVALLLRAGAKE